MTKINLLMLLILKLMCTHNYTLQSKWTLVSKPANGRLHLKCDGTRAKTRVRLSAKRTSPFKSAWASVQSTTGSRGVRIIGSNAGYTMFRGSVKGTGYPLHSPVSPSLPLPCVTVCHHISTGVYWIWLRGLQLTLAVVCYDESRFYPVCDQQPM